MTADLEKRKNEDLGFVVELQKLDQNYRQFFATLISSSAGKKCRVGNLVPEELY